MAPVADDTQFISPLVAELFSSSMTVAFTSGPLPDAASIGTALIETASVFTVTVTQIVSLIAAGGGTAIA